MESSLRVVVESKSSADLTLVLYTQLASLFCFSTRTASSSEDPVTD